MATNLTANLTPTTDFAPFVCDVLFSESTVNLEHADKGMDTHDIAQYIHQNKYAWKFAHSTFTYDIFIGYMQCGALSCLHSLLM